MAIIQTIIGNPAVAAKHDTATSRASERASWGNDGFGFDDLIDILNPLHHIPIISEIYRDVTGDEIAPAAQVMGGGVFGGIVGLASSTAQLIAAQEMQHNAPTALASVETPSTEHKISAHQPTAEPKGHATELETRHKHIASLYPTHPELKRQERYHLYT